jgi:hypothetical protein
MNIRKIAAAASFAAGAALAFAPLASADNTADLTTLFDSEASSLNSIFTSDASLADVYHGDITTGGAGFVDPALLSDAPNSGTPTAFDFLLYGVDPIGQASSLPNAADVYNGALAKFDDAVNVELYALENGGNLLPQGDWATDLFGGSTSTVIDAFSTDTVGGAVSALLTDSYNDIVGFFTSSALD